MQSPHTAILLAAFGSRLPDASKALERMRQQASALYPDFRVETALTSGTVRRHKGAQSRHGRSPEDILRTLRKEGVTRLAVQSLHVIPGDEYKGLERLVESLRGPKGFASIELGRPLLGNREDIRRVALTILTVLPPERAPGEAVLLMGHGTRGKANGVYHDLADELRALDPLVLIGALEAEPGLAAKVDELRALGAKRVHLMPLLFARGVHALRDMAGDMGDDPGDNATGAADLNPAGKGRNSWQAGLTAAGFSCAAHVKGAGEHQALAEIWLDHLHEAVARLHEAVTRLR